MIDKLKRTCNSSNLRGTFHIPRLGVQSLRFAGLGLPAGIQHGVQVPRQRNYELNVLLPQVAELRSSGCAKSDLALMLLYPSAPLLCPYAGSLAMAYIQSLCCNVFVIHHQNSTLSI